MAPISSGEQYRRLREAVLPVLAEAAIGNFTAHVPLEQAQPRELLELLSGVEMLLEVIRQQQAELAEARRELTETRQRTTEILDEVLERSLEETLPEQVKTNRRGSA